MLILFIIEYFHMVECLVVICDQTIMKKYRLKIGDKNYIIENESRLNNPVEDMHYKCFKSTI